MTQWQFTHTLQHTHSPPTRTHIHTICCGRNLSPPSSPTTLPSLPPPVNEAGRLLVCVARAFWVMSRCLNSRFSLKISGNGIDSSEWPSPSFPCRCGGDWDLVCVICREIASPSWSRGRFVFGWCLRGGARLLLRRHRALYMSHIRISHVAHMNQSCRTCQCACTAHVAHIDDPCQICHCVRGGLVWLMFQRMCDASSMGWLWLARSIKLQVSFAKETCKRDYILQKRPIILSILLTVATPYDIIVHCTCCTHKSVMSHIWISHVTQVTVRALYMLHEAVTFYTNARALYMLRILMSHVTHTNGSGEGLFDCCFRDI